MTIAVDPPLLKVADLSINFGGVSALSKASLTVEPRSITSLVGPNGAGKTTLFNCVTRLYQPREGSVMLGDINLLEIPSHGVAAVGVARTFQHSALIDDMTILENVMAGAHHWASSGFLTTAVRTKSVTRREEQSRETALRELDYLGLLDIWDALPNELPHGTLKRVEIARALVSRPQIVMLDEPASGLMHSEVDELAILLKRIRSERNISLLVVEHHMALVMSISDSVTVLDAGSTIAVGTPREVASDPRVQRAYLGGAA